MGFFEDLVASLQGFVQNEPAPDWKYREDPILGGRDRIEVSPLSMYGGPNITDTRASLYRDAVERMGGKEALMGNAPEDEGSWFSRTPLGQDLAKYTVDGKIQLPFEPGPAIAGIAEKRKKPDEAPPSDLPLLGVDPMRAKAKEKIDARQALEEEEIAKLAAHEAEKQRLLEAAGIQNQQREFMQGTVPLVEDYDKRIAIGGDPERGSAEDIMFRIRAEARAKGRGGNLMGNRPTEQDYIESVTPTGGGFTTAEMNPQIAARLGERDAWLAQQPLRDAQFESDLARQRRDLSGQQVASEKLLKLRDQEIANRRSQLLESVVGEVGASGKIPYEKAAKLRQLGLPIDVSMIGTNPESAISYFSALQQEAGQFLSGINPIDAQVNPSIKKRADAERIGALLANEYQRKIKDGYDPDLAMKEYQEVMMQYILANGLQNYLQLGSEPGDVTPVGE